MQDAYDYITLLCRLKAAQARNKELEFGEREVSQVGNSPPKRLQSI